MNIIVSARLKPSQVRYKIIPLTKVEAVENIYILRKDKGPQISKVSYIILPSICKIKLFNILLTPIILVYQIKKLRIDLIISYNFIPHGLFAYVASKLTRVPFNYSQIDTNTIELVKKQNLFSHFIIKALKKAVFINVPGKISRNFYIAQGINPDKIHLLHSTIDTDNEYFPENINHMYDLIYVGVLEKRKNVDILIHAIVEVKESFPSINFAIIGDGPEKPELVKLSKYLNVDKNIHFLGYQDNIKAFMNKSKIFILASRLEGIPCAVMEAMSLELYPIVRDVADISDLVINNYNGSLLPENYNSNDFAVEIVKILKSWESIKHMRINARKHIQKNHSYWYASQKWEKILDGFK